MHVDGVVQNFWREVASGADPLRGGFLNGVGRLVISDGQAKVRYAAGIVGLDQDVPRFDVAVSNRRLSFRARDLLVEMSQAAHGGMQELQHRGLVQRFDKQQLVQ